MIKTAIFDLDGTLINTLADLAAACNYALEECGFPSHETEEYRYFVGNGVIRLIERIIPPGKLSPGVSDRIHVLFDKYYHEHYNVFSKPYDGIEDTLDTLIKGGVKCAVVSNKPDEFTNIIIKEYFGGRFFCVRGNIPGTAVKPDPAGVRYVLDEAGVNTDEAVMIGDSAVDMETAKNAGIKSIGCLWGFRDEKELRESGADMLAHSPSELTKLIIG